MADKLRIEVITPQGVMLDREVEEVVAPGILGEFGVLIGHTPMLTFIKPGILSYLEDNKFTKFVVGQGFCEVLKDSVTVLVEEAYRRDDIDPNQASTDVTELEEQLKGVDPTAQPAEHERITNKLRLARYKVALISSS